MASESEGVLDFSMRSKAPNPNTRLFIPRTREMPSVKDEIQEPVTSTDETSDSPSSHFTEQLFRNAFLDPSLLNNHTLDLYSQFGMNASSSDNSFLNNSLALAVLNQRKRKKSITPKLEENDGSCSEGNTDSPRKSEIRDTAYWERRRKNNIAAKRSRDARRSKEDEIAFRAAILEQENLKLKAQVNVLKSEMSRLHTMLFSNSQRLHCNLVIKEEQGIQ